MKVFLYINNLVMIAGFTILKLEIEMRPSSTPLIIFISILGDLVQRNTLLRHGLHTFVTEQLLIRHVYSSNTQTNTRYLATFVASFPVEGAIFFSLFIF